MLALLLWLSSLAAQAPAARAPEAAVDLDHWQTMVEGPKFETDGLLVRAGGTKRGWTRSQEIYLDGTLRLKFRLATPDAEGEIFVRAMLTEAAGWPAWGYRIGIRGAADAKHRTGTVFGFSTRKETSPLVSAIPIADAAWHDLEVSTIRDHVIVRIDGNITADFHGQEPHAGYVGLAHSTGVLEFRDLTMAEIPVAHAPSDAGRHRDAAKRQNGPIKNPRLLKEVKPLYAIGPRQRGIKGVTRLEVVVDETGHVIDERILQSLDRELDLAAVAAGRHWLFAPATKDGVPITILVTLEMTF